MNAQPDHTEQHRITTLLIEISAADSAPALIAETLELTEARIELFQQGVL